ncbi:MAG TPA: hypothetical protein VL202_18495 [Pararhizobium sp.]|uniref:hypothetical protein n=1 Tax=Pararhizobium sp. TaxID=1977563 RepID=UPI002BFC0154|nr:hypothetical protein [Pararhizobium sp.]HTO33143.1 hypothetical protein [Pararhizobium sp.]
MCEELATVNRLVAHVVVRRGTPQKVVAELLSNDPADLIVTGISRADVLPWIREER